MGQEVAARVGGPLHDRRHGSSDAPSQPPARPRPFLIPLVPPQNMLPLSLCGDGRRSCDAKSNRRGIPNSQRRCRTSPLPRKNSKVPPKPGPETPPSMPSRRLADMMAFLPDPTSSPRRSLSTRPPPQSGFADASCLTCRQPLRVRMADKYGRGTATLTSRLLATLCRRYRSRL